MIEFFVSLVSFAGGSAQAAEHAPAPAPEIVVVAPKLTGDALAACLERRCSVVEDARATIRHAQAQFANGKYADARSALWGSIERNRKHESTQPRAVSALFHALSRVTLHNGDMDEYRRTVLRSAAILARSPLLDPHERLGGQIRLGDAYASLGEQDMARAAYRSARSAAEGAGAKSLADMIRVREVWLRVLSGQDSGATAMLVAMAGDQSLAPEAQRSAAMIAGGKLRPGTYDFARMLDLASQAGRDDAVLIWSPGTPVLAATEAQKHAEDWNSPAAAASGAPRGELLAVRWADFGYWVRPDGNVEGVRVIASKGNRNWTRKLVEMFAARRYAPFTPKPGSNGLYRVERVSLTHTWLTPISSVIRRRAGVPSYQFERLSEDPFGPRADQAN